MTAAAPKAISVLVEYEKCRLSCSYFINTYVKIYDATNGEWIPFLLWPEQEQLLGLVVKNPLIIALKARQLGITWLILSYLLWLMIFSPIATVLVFSRRDDDAIYLLSDERMRGMYNRLPSWLKTDKIISSSSHMWTLSNKSNARAFPTTGGDSYTATAVLVDEADLIQDLNRLLRSTKPTIDAGGKLILISRADKSEPASEFKEIYRASRRGENGWVNIFLPWYVRPERTRAWYEQQKADITSRTGALDDLYEQYPETDEQALAPRSLDKRIHYEWLLKCFRRKEKLEQDLAIPGLIIYEEPKDDCSYSIGADPAEGNPLSDDSAISVINDDTGEEAACIANKYEPAVFGNIIRQLSYYFKNAPVLVERNNHGHAVILWLQDNSNVDLMLGLDGKPGWLQNSKSKAMLYDQLAEGTKEAEYVLHTERIYRQLSSIEGSSLRAPDGMMDDLAVSWALARYCSRMIFGEAAMMQGDVLW